MTDGNAQQIVFTLTARCRDCYRCLRSCPVKAIRMRNGQAYVDEERCIACGTCIRECPQQAKSFRSDIDTAMKIVDNCPLAAASIAPSFAALFNNWQRKRLASALRSLGFRYVGQTSQGAYQVAQATLAAVRKNKGAACISTACPAVVNFVEKYRPELSSRLVPVVSPMIAHGRMLKQKLGKECRVIFIGPCVAKKSEVQRPEHAGIVDVALTFRELLEWFERKGVNLSGCEESGFDEEPVENAQFFPLPGGLVRTAGLESDGLELDVLETSGPLEVKSLIDSVSGHKHYFLLEPLFCEGGCIAGPGMGGDTNLFSRRKELIEYALETKNGVVPERLDPSLFKGEFFPKPQTEREPTEEEILKVFELTGKSDPQDRLNCGACGYGSCREKAIAVIQGMAEPEMCVPYMRRLAERRTDRIIETSPNGIVIVDHNLSVISMNPAFRHFFGCSETALGKHISTLMDPGPFERLASGEELSVELTARHENRGIICHELLYALKEEKQFVGIFVNMTGFQDNEKKLTEMKSQTLAQAKELLEHQVRMAQNIAQFLGESTAKGEELVRKLVDLTDHEPDKQGK